MGDKWLISACDSAVPALMRFTLLPNDVNEIDTFAKCRALTSHLSPTVLLVECRTKCSSAVVQTVPSVYSLAPRDYLVASCMCEARMRIFNAFVFSVKVFNFSAKGVHLQHQKCLSPAQIAFIASNKHVCLQCDSCLEVSSRDYLIASDERVRLQCEIIFRG